MTGIDDIISDISHRPYPLPEGQWKYYQEWNQVLFFHWAVPFEVLRKCVPERLQVDEFDGNCYVSLVAFKMQKLRPGFLPALSLVSDFEEINLRTYIDNDNKKGVYFLSIEAGKALSTFLARAISGLPYIKSVIERTDKMIGSTNSRTGLHFATAFSVKQELEHKKELDKWLTERYCLYLDKGDRFYRYDIHHKEWGLRSVEVSRLELNYKAGDFELSGRQPDLTHYSDGIKVVAWGREELE